MKESNLQTLFSKVIDRNKTAVYELKLEKGKSMPFDKVKKHQLLGLKQAKSGGLYHKLIDMPHFQGMKARFDTNKPFDCFTMNHAEAYIGICFYEPRKPKEVILIDIDDFVKEINESKRKSLTRSVANEISTRIMKI